MLKLLAQIIALLLGYQIGKYLGWHWLGTGAAIVVLMVGVHLVWERIFFNPYHYLGVMPIADDDPIMEKAFARAKETLDVFLNKIYPEHPEDSMVKFRYKNEEDETEHLWADLVSYEDQLLNIYIRTPPIKPREGFVLTASIRPEEVVDWSVEYRDGTLRGGFTNRALFKIFERQEGYMHAEFEKHMGRFKEIETES